MWQTFIEYITSDALHITLFICIVVLSIIGFGEIIYQIIRSAKKIETANEYIKHINIIAEHVNKRLSSRNYSYDTTDLNEIAESLNYVEINYDKAEECIEEDSYNIPIYSLYSMLFHRKWDDNDVATYCHQIYINYQRSIPKHQRTIKNFLWCVIIPFTKLYRGFCVLFRIITYPIKKLLAQNNHSFDKSGRWEKIISLLAEIVTIVNFIYEFSKA